jgi:LacI family transcriptional regulator
LQIPNDIALVAFDEVDWMAVVRPPVTVAAQPTRELGRTAAELLLERVSGSTRPLRVVLLEPTLIIRQSCARHLGTDAVPGEVIGGDLISAVR